MLSWLTKFSLCRWDDQIWNIWTGGRNLDGSFPKWICGAAGSNIFIRKINIRHWGRNIGQRKMNIRLVKINTEIPSCEIDICPWSFSKANQNVVGSYLTDYLSYSNIYFHRILVTRNRLQLMMWSNKWQLYVSFWCTFATTTTTTFTSTTTIIKRINLPNFPLSYLRCPIKKAPL